MSRDGNGVHVIMKTLNAEEKPARRGLSGPIRRSLSCFVARQSLVRQHSPVSKNPDGTRQPVEPIPDFLPPVIDKALFYECKITLRPGKEFTWGGSSLITVTCLEAC